MAVHCKNCGEELLGAVNRCWLCGELYNPRAVEAEAEAVAAPVAAVLVDEEAEDSGNSPTEVSASDSDQPAQPDKKPIRRGSPFADSFELKSSPNPAPAVNRPRAPEYPQHAASIGGAIGATVLGLLSLIGLVVSPIGGMTTSILGIAMGLWGLYSNKRGVALLGLVLCCLALALATFFAVVQLYESIYGEHPFRKPLEEIDDSDFDRSESNLNLFPFPETC